MHIVIRKQPQVIKEFYDIPLPFSHWFETRVEALKWMMNRGLQKDCYVVNLGKFLMLGGHVDL